MIRKGRSSKSGSTGSKMSKGAQQPEWEEGANGGDSSPRSDGADGVKERCNSKDNDKSMTGLQSKNYKLAKELSEIRVRCREESKNVTRLTMENMNLASRCREAITQAATLKKELSMQKKKTAEAVAQTVAVIEQLKKMQRLQKQSSSTIAADAPPISASSDTDKAAVTKPAAVVTPSSPEKDLSPTDSMTHSESSDADEIVVVETPAVVVHATAAGNDDSVSSDAVNDAPLTVTTPTAQKSVTTDSVLESPVQSYTTTPVTVVDAPAESDDITEVKQSTPLQTSEVSKKDLPLVTPPTVDSVPAERETKGLTVDDVIEEMDAEEALERNLLMSDDDIVIDTTTTADVIIAECDDSDDIMEISGEELNFSGTVEERNAEKRENEWLSAVSVAVSEARKAESYPLPPPGSHAPESGLVSSDDYDETGVSVSESSGGGCPVEGDNGDDGDSQRAVKGSKGDLLSTYTSQESNPTPPLAVKEKDQSTSAGSPLRKALSSLLHKKDRTSKETKSPKKERKGGKVDIENHTVAPVPTVEKQDAPVIEKREVDRATSKSSLSKLDPVVEVSKRPLTLTEDLAGMVRESKTDDLWREDFDEAAETEDIITSLHSEGPVKKNYFADSASPIIKRFHPNAKFPRMGSSFNEEMPSDMIQQPHRSGRVGTLGSFQKDEKDGTSSTLLSSIDAFEASFNTNFPESFATKDRESALAKKATSTSTKAASDISIYNPFDTESPSKIQTSLEISDNSDDDPLSPVGHWGMKRAKDRVAYLRANSRNTKRSSEDDASPQKGPPTHTEEPLTPTESIVSIARSADKEEMKNEKVPSLSASSYRMIRKSLSAEKRDQKSLSVALQVPDLGYQKFTPVATPTKGSSNLTSLDRFSAPMEQPAVPGRPEKSLGYSEARNRYETALGQRSTQRAGADRRSRAAQSHSDRSMRSSTSTSVRESSTLKSKDYALQPTSTGPRVRERAALFSASPAGEGKGVSPRNSWDEGDIPMRSSLSPTSGHKTELSVGARNPYAQSLNKTAVSFPAASSSLPSGGRPWRQQRQESPNHYRMDERLISAPSMPTPQDRQYGRPNNGADGALIRQVPGQPQQRHGLNREV